MKVLVVNIGSTSFKFQLLDMESEQVLARGSVEGVGRPASKTTIQIADNASATSDSVIADQSAAIEFALAQLRDADLSSIDAVGFKAVHGGHISRPVCIDDDVLRTMENFTDAAPAHNPPYIAAMRAFQAQMPRTPLVAAFETGFHQTIPPERTTFAIPHTWCTEHGVRRYGFHGASHRYVSMRVAEIVGRDDQKIISCHLGGSSSVCAINAGRSIANSFGMTPQGGLPQNNRVGDFDPYALLRLKSLTGQSIEDLLATMAKEGGLLGISGLSNDMPEILAAETAGDKRAALAIGTFVESVRHYIGAYLVALGGLDVLTFTGGIGERSAEIRSRVCDGLQFLGIELDTNRNAAGGTEATVSKDGAAVRVMTLRTNEELVVARQTRDVLSESCAAQGCRPHERRS